MKPEIHLIILWETARSAQPQILEHLVKQPDMRIIECQEIEWTPALVFSNFARFYGVKLADCEGKIQECGRGKFLLVTLLDEQPQYGLVETSRGHETVNTRMFALKELYRSWTQGGHKVHTTNHPKETDHDLVLLLGKNAQNYLAEAPQSWNGEVIALQRDLTGAHGWASMEELFFVLNHTLRYVVLRNWEMLPKEFSSELHGDIDLLVEDFDNALHILNAVQTSPEKGRVACKNLVAGQEVFWDLRFLGDDYYCRRWEVDLLARRVLNERGIYTSTDEDYFYTLIYHALIHKVVVAPDYYEKLERLIKLLPREDPRGHGLFDTLFALYENRLREWMEQRRYHFTKPHDPSVHYNLAIANLETAIAKLQKYLPLERIQFLGINQSSDAHIHLAATWEGRRVFIKYAPCSELVRNEFHFGKILSQAAPEHFLQPLFYRADDGEKLIIFDYIEGINLAHLDEISPEDIPEICRQMQEISEVLMRHRFVHCDLLPQNLVWTRDRRLILCDLAWMRDLANPSILHFMRNNPLYAEWINGEYKPSLCQWDNQFSFWKIVQEMGAENSIQEFFQKNIGRDTFEFKYPKPKNYFFRYWGYRFLSIIIRGKSHKRYREKLLKLKKELREYHKTLVS